MTPEKEITIIKPEAAPKTRYELVKRVEGQGLYRLDMNPNDPDADYTNPRYQGGLKDLRRLFDSLIIALSNWKYPKAVLRDISFIDREGWKKKKAILEILPDFKPKYPFYLLGSIEHNNETYRYRVDPGGSYSIDLQDVGNLWMANGGLRISKSKGRDGSLEAVVKSQGTPLMSEADRNWHGLIRVNGENPGILIKDSIATVNTCLSSRPDWPLWKALAR